MTKEDYSEKVQELMSNPKNIRNIGIVSHIHHGKCVSQDTRIMITDGSVNTAKDIFNKAERLGVKTLEEDDKTVYDVSNENISVFSLNKNTGKIEKKRIQYAWKLRGGKLIKVKLRNGAELKTTPEHKYIVLDNEEFVERPAEELRIGSRVVCSRRLCPENDFKIKSCILEKLSQKNFYVWLESDFGKKIKDMILLRGLKSINKEINSDKKYKSLYHGAWQNRYNLIDLLKICKIFNINLEELYEKIEWIAFRKGKQHGKNSCKQKLPKNFEDLFYLAGLFIGDGSKHKFVVGKPALAKKLIKILDEMKVKYYLRNYSYQTPEIAVNFTLINILNSLFDYPLKKKSHNVKISELVFKSPKNLVCQFVRGYFDCDGTVEKSRGAISLNSASVQILKDMQLLLLRFGCLSIIQDDTIYLSGLSAKIFASDIRFSLEEKQLKAEILAQNVIGSYALDKVVIKNKNQFLFGIKVLNPKLTTGDLAFIEVTSIESLEEDEVYDFTIPDNHNFIAEGMVVHNTTLTDNLAAAAGLMARELVGERMLTWVDDQERERLMTIYGATVTMAHDYEEQRHLINLLDTPGHVDFGADVTQAMRAVDGAVVLCCAVEGVMPQTETVLKQALRERVKPILFINKVDRAIRELKLTPEQLQKRLANIVIDVNKFIQRHIEPQFKDKWLVKVEDGSVAFGSALKKWAISVPYMQRSGVTFKQIIDLCSQGKDDELANMASMHTIVLDMVIKHLPSPLEAQKYRIEKIWKGDMNSEIGKQLFSCDSNGKLAAVITKVTYDPHAGIISTTRIFSGKLERGQDIYIVNTGQTIKVQQVTTFIALRRIPIEYALAGNVVGLVGLSEAAVGQTISDPSYPIEEFEAIKHIFEPVVTKSIEPKYPQDLPKLIEILKTLSREDTTLNVKINQETGETLVSGLGELHLDAKVERKIREKGVEIVVSPPIVVYRESIFGSSPEIEGKSPNKHNKFYISVESVTPEIYKAMTEGVVKDAEIKGKNLELRKKLVELGMDKEDAKDVILIHNHCMFLDCTKGIQYLNESIEDVKAAFIDVTENGPLSKEPCAAVIVKLHDAELHEDAVHRGPAQIMPAVRHPIIQGMLKVGVTYLEPRQIIRVDTPQDYIGNVTAEINNRRGEILNVEQEEYSAVITAKVPTAELFGFEGALKSATAGKGFQSLMDVAFEKIPNELRDQVAIKIRERKGLPKELPKPEI